MCNAEKPDQAAPSIFHFLYIDSNSSNWDELNTALNPPELPERFLLDQDWQEKQIHQNYNLLFTYAPNFQEAIYSVVNHNVDEAYLAMARKYPFNRPFNGIIYELKTGASPEIYRWNHFLEDLSSLGFKSLKLTDGFIAFGKRFNDEIREILMRHNTRKIIKYKNFSIEQLKTELLDYLNLIDESNLFKVDRQITHNDQGQVDYIDRIVQFENEKHGKRRLHLARMSVNEETRFSRLVPPPSNDDFSAFEPE
jgi:hypothetical protein